MKKSKWTSSLTIVILLVMVLVCVGAGKSKKPRRVLVTVTGYCPCKICCGEHADGKTSTGRSAWKAGVAVDPEFIALGSHIDIPENIYKRGPNNNGSWIKADDVGGKIKGMQIDLRFLYHWKAKKVGRRKIWVRIHDRG